MADDVLKIEDVVGTASLDVRVLAGSGGLQREVLWAHSCEMADPAQWLGPHELLMTVGLCVPRDASDQVEFVARIDDAGLAGLMIGDHDPAPPLSREMLDEADRRGFPVLLAGARTPYAVVARHVAAANWSAHSLQVMRLSKLYQAATDAQGDLPELLRQLVLVLRVGLRLEDARYGITIASAEHRIDRHAETTSRRHHLRGAQPADLIVTEYVGEPLDAFLLVHVQKMLEVATAGVLNSADRRSEVSRAVMRDLLNSTIPGHTAELIAPHLPSDGFRLAAVRNQDREALARAVALADAPIIVGAGRNVGLALVPAAATGTLRRIRDELDLRVGVSSTFFEYGDTRTAAGEAARVLAASEHTDATWSEYEGSTLAVLTRSHREAAEIVTGVLGPIADRTPRTDTLRDTLFAYLRNDRRWAETSEELDIHRQTLSYRLRRIGEETGLDLARTADLSALWIAMQAWETLQAGSQSARS